MSKKPSVLSKSISASHSHRHQGYPKSTHPQTSSLIAGERATWNRPQIFITCALLFCILFMIIITITLVIWVFSTGNTPLEVPVIALATASVGSIGIVTGVVGQVILQKKAPASSS